ncbi:MAG: hypothetical protein CMP11_03185 [Zetaproteobacteria bacterium]|nr:hypothetical protein [Pseudobdellovibrionaceae bacterium]|tara:strand:+ start:189 stop:479 length:291 start_codon:yes stop_codon:yes gene_type:complete
MKKREIFQREYWTGDSKDGVILSGDGYHFFRMDENGDIYEAYELYESDDGDEVVTPMPELQNLNWFKDLGFDSFEILDRIQKSEFLRVKCFMENKN